MMYALHPLGSKTCLDSFADTEHVLANASIIATARDQVAPAGVGIEHVGATLVGKRRDSSDCRNQRQEQKRADRNVISQVCSHVGDPRVLS